MSPLIEVNGPRAQVQAEAIARHYGTKAFLEDNVWWVVCNEQLEKAFCIDEDKFLEAIKEVAAATGISISPDDICF